MFAIDSSGSINSRNFETVRQFTMGVINELDVDSGRVKVNLNGLSHNIEQIILNNWITM